MTRPTTTAASSPAPTIEVVDNDPLADEAIEALAALLIELADKDHDP